MTAVARIAAMARLRSRLQDTPLAKACLLGRARAGGDGQNGPRLHVITEITCFEDLTASLSLQQIQAMGLDLHLTLCLPSPLAARLCARRVAEAQLTAPRPIPSSPLQPSPIPSSPLLQSLTQVKVAPLPDPAHVLRTLPPGSVVAQVPADVLLLPSFVAALRQVLAGGGGVADPHGVRLETTPPLAAPEPSAPLCQPLLPLLDGPAHHALLPSLMLQAIQRAAQAAPFPPVPSAATVAPDPVVVLPQLRCYLNRGGAGNPVVRAFADAIGAPLAYVDSADLSQGSPVVWGVLRGSDLAIEAARADGRDFYYIDHAYFDRGHGRNYRITRNGYEAGPVRAVPGDRAAALGVALQPWRSGGSEILICPPTAHFQRAHGCADWLERTLSHLKQLTDRPLVIREKPKPDETLVPLEEALQTAHALVTHSSNVAIEAAVMGTPVFVSPRSAAAPVGLTDLSQIESPVRPDRAPWLAHLAYSQFSMEEIRDGTAWRLLQEADG